jgi:hypothetical protein
MELSKEPRVCHDVYPIVIPFPRLAQCQLDFVVPTKLNSSFFLELPHLGWYPPPVQGAARCNFFLKKNGGPIGGCALDKEGPWAKGGGTL